LRRQPVRSQDILFETLCEFQISPLQLIKLSETQLPSFEFSSSEIEITGSLFVKSAVLIEEQQIKPIPIDPISNSSSVSISLRAFGFTQKPLKKNYCPFAVLSLQSKKMEVSETTLGKTNVSKFTHNPQWDPFQIDMSQIGLDTTISMKVFDWNQGEHILLGERMISLRELCLQRGEFLALTMTLQNGKRLVSGKVICQNVSPFLQPLLSFSGLALSLEATGLEELIGEKTHMIIKSSENNQIFHVSKLCSIDEKYFFLKNKQTIIINLLIK